MHRTLKQDCLRPPAATLVAQQISFDAFRHSYNTERPHQALGQCPPASLYVPSSRSYPARLVDPCYPSDFVVRRVRSNGQVKWRGELIFIGEALTGEAIGLTENASGWCAYFGPTPLGILDPIKPSIQRLPIPAGPVTYVPS